MFVDAIHARQALERDEFTPYFQPLVDLRTGKLSGFEVLARWIRPGKDLIPPDEFIPLAEKDGWIGILMQQILRKSLAAASSLPEPITLSVNISTIQLRDLTLPKQIRSAAERTGFSLDRLMLEITESALTDNLERALSIAKELKAMGCKLALDDFGTGYSSLLHLQSLPFDELKVDRSFVGSMTGQRDSRKIVAAIVGLGQSLGLTTVAEGVETQEQAEMLLWMGCELGQGWLFGKPTPAAHLDSVLASPRQRIVPGLSNPWKDGAVGNLDALPSQRLAQLQAVYDGAPVGLAFLDRNLRHVNLNQRLADMNGFPVADHIGHTPEEMVPEAFPLFEPYLRRALQGEAITGIEIKKPASGTGSGGSETTLLVSYQPTRDEAGEVAGVSVAIVDITERKRSEDALRESEDHYRHMVQLNPQTPWIMDPEGHTLAVSPEWESTTSLAIEHTRDPAWATAVHPDDLQSTTDTIAEFVRAGQPINVEYRVKALNGGWRWMRSRGDPRYDTAGKLVCWYGTVEDIDESRQKADVLRKTQAQLRAVVAAVPLGILLVDSQDGSLTLANPEAMRILREPVNPLAPVNPTRDFPLPTPWREATADGKSSDAVHAPLARVLDRALIHGESTAPAEVLFHRSDGSDRSDDSDGAELWVKLSAAPVLGEDHEIIGGVVVLQDIQDIHDAKQERQRLLNIAEALMHEFAPSPRIPASTPGISLSDPSNAPSIQS